MLTIPGTPNLLLIRILWSLSGGVFEGGWVVLIKKFISSSIRLANQIV